MPNMLIIGPQGAGKGTQAALLAGRLDVPHISTGDIFRANAQAKTELGLECQRYMDAGELVPDSVTSTMVADRLTEPDTGKGFFLDGFPRTIDQATALSALLEQPLDVVLVLDAPNNVVLDRMLLRGRVDDTSTAIQRRLDLYYAETSPLLELYQQILVTVDGIGSVEEVQDRIWDSLAPLLN